MKDLFATMGLQLINLPRARATDPVTSIAAAAHSRQFSTGHAVKILNILRSWGCQYGGDGWTAKDIAEAVGLSVVQVDRRLPELRAAGLVRVVQADGKDWIRDGFRIWEAVE